MNDYQAQVIQRLQLHQETNKGISIPNWALDLVDNDFHTAIFLKQVVFWSTKTTNPDGFYKSYKEWTEESRLSRYHVQQAVKVIHELAGCPLITITKKKVNGAPTLFYKLDWQAFHQWICKSLTNGNETVLQMEMQNSSQMDLQESRISLRADGDLHTDKSQTENADSSSSPTSSAPSTPAVEEKEVPQSSDLPLERQAVLEKAYSDLCGVWEGSPSPVKAQVKVNLQLLLSHTPDLTPGDFVDFKTYYDTCDSKKAKYPKPSPNFVTGGWETFIGWQAGYLAEVVRDTLPGIERSFPMSRGDWRDLNQAAVGDMHKIGDSRMAYVYQKQTDGLWIEVPRAEWPEWARESA